MCGVLRCWLGIILACSSLAPLDTTSANTCPSSPPPPPSPPQPGWVGRWDLPVEKEARGRHGGGMAASVIRPSAEGMRMGVPAQGTERQERAAEVSPPSQSRDAAHESRSSGREEPGPGFTWPKKRNRKEECVNLKAGSEKRADFTFRFLCPEWRLKLILNDVDARRRWMTAYTSLVPPPEYTRGRGRKKRNGPVFPLVGRVELDPILMLHAVASRGGAERVDRERQWKQVASAIGIPGNFTGSSSVIRRHYMRLLLPIEETEMASSARDPRQQAAPSAPGASRSSSGNGAAVGLTRMCHFCGRDGAKKGVSLGGDRWGGWVASVCDVCCGAAKRELRSGKGLNSRIGEEAAAMCKMVAGRGKDGRWKGLRGVLRDMYIKEMGRGRWRRTDGLERWKWKGESWVAGKIMPLERRCSFCPRKAVEGRANCSLHSSAKGAETDGIGLRDVARPHANEGEGDGSTRCAMCAGPKAIYGVGGGSRWLARGLCRTCSKAQCQRQVAGTDKVVCLNMARRCEMCTKVAAFGNPLLRAVILSSAKGGRWGKTVPGPGRDAEPARKTPPIRLSTGSMLSMRCKGHKRQEDVDVVHQRCIGSPTCRRRPIFGVLAGGARPVHCARHHDPALEVDIVHRRCQADECTVAAVFSLPGNRAARCAAHREHGDVDVVNKRCTWEGCSKAARYGPRGKGAITCKGHAQKGHMSPWVV